jgi:TIR domain-containing protein
LKIFLSHRSRDKALVREFRSLLPDFLDTWLDEDSLTWGESFPAELRTSIQSGVDFLILFLDNEALDSKWVQQELAWAMEREKELKRTFVLPILLEEVAAGKMPPGLAERQYLRLDDFNRASVESLASRATLQLFHLVVQSFSGLQLDPPRRETLRGLRDQLSAGQARLLGHIVGQCKSAPEVTQREIEGTLGFSHASAELFYRLESLIARGFLLKRRMAENGEFSYRLSDAFQEEVREE